jgi:flagellin-like hook-associated protein FlgL
MYQQEGIFCFRSRMSSPIYSRLENIFTTLKNKEGKLEETLNKLSSGIKRPWDDIADFEKAQSFSMEKAKQMGMMRSLQLRGSQAQSGIAFLQEIRSSLTEMSGLATKAISGIANAEDRILYDESFQEIKENLAFSIDGFSGTQIARASFAQNPLFLGNQIITDLSQDSGMENDNEDEINLYTAYSTPGFDTIRLRTQDQEQITLQGEVSSVEQGESIFQLDEEASAIDQVYSGLFVTVTKSDQSASQRVKISDYDASQRTITLEEPLSFSIEVGDFYEVESGVYNTSAYEQQGHEELTFASFVWGADNNRSGELGTSGEKFIALTDTEKNYREQQGIPDTNLTAQTFNEKQARREKNIFDSEYGSLKTSSQAKTMFEQVNNAIEKISTLTARYGSQAKFLEMRYGFLQRNSNYNALGEEAFGGIDVAKETAIFSKQKSTIEGMYEVARMVSENYAKLTSLIRKSY